MGNIFAEDPLPPLPVEDRGEFLAVLSLTHLEESLMGAFSTSGSLSNREG